MNKLLIICGPTATGKTSLGILLAKKFNGEIVSADSRQVYRGMNIGTGKGLPVNPKFKISHFTKVSRDQQIGYYTIGSLKVWLYDISAPDYQFNVADYVECAQIVIEDIWRRGKLPILVGGTGFYIKALIDGIETVGVEPDWKLREHLDSWTVSQLGSHLRKIDHIRWGKMNESDRQNPRRLIRAIEVVLGRKVQSTKYKVRSLECETIWVGLKTPFKKLYRRIDQHVEKRVKEGIEKEIESLLNQGFNWKNSVLKTTIGYREWRPLFESTKYEVRNAMLKAETTQRWKFSEHAYARRQMTWFKKQPGIHWFDIANKNWQSSVEQLVKRCYYKK